MPQSNAPTPVDSGAKIEDVVYFSERGVTVTRSRAVIFSATYPINTISAVQMVKVPKNNTMLVIGVSLVAFGALVAAFTMSGVGGMAFMIGLLICVYDAATQKEQFGLKLGAAGVEKYALLSDDKNFVDGVAQAINQALAARY